MTTHLEDRLSDFGVDVIDTHRAVGVVSPGGEHLPGDVPGAGSLGLLLGTVGLGAVLARNVLERRREIGLLRAVGYSPGEHSRHGAVRRHGAGPAGCCSAPDARWSRSCRRLRDRAQSLPIGSLGVLLIGVGASPGRSRRWSRSGSRHERRCRQRSKAEVRCVSSATHRHVHLVVCRSGRSVERTGQPAARVAAVARAGA